MKLDRPLNAIVASAFLSLVLVDCAGDGGGGGGNGTGFGANTGGSLNGSGGGSSSGGGLGTATGGATVTGVGGSTDLDLGNGSGGSDVLGVCDNVDFEITGRVVDVLIVLDRSTSMTQSGLWRPMGAALTKVTAATDTGVDFGLLTYPFTNDQCSTGDIILGITDPSAAAIADLVGGGAQDVGTTSGTPTAASLRVAKAYLDTVADGRSKFVLLATDGAPNCNDTLDSATCTCSVPSMGAACEARWCLDDAGTAAAAAELYAAGYPVFVLGIGESVEWANVMNQIALAGGTDHYRPAESDEFEAELNDIVGGVMSCEFDVDWTSLSDTAVADPGLVNLYCKQSSAEPNSDDAATGNALLWNAGCDLGASGWEWPDETYSVIRLCPDTCNAIKNGGCPVISATFGCDSRPVK